MKGRIILIYFPGQNFLIIHYLDIIQQYINVIAQLAEGTHQKKLASQNSQHARLRNRTFAANLPEYNPYAGINYCRHQKAQRRLLHKHFASRIGSFARWKLLQVHIKLSRQGEGNRDTSVSCCYQHWVAVLWTELHYYPVATLYHHLFIHYNNIQVRFQRRGNF
ncbi:hypothetical protein FGO68_gene14458 [Halteria grandinella]|uniref:Uncharacterized protein n=1 Tax=Halteria grandinella TaxID=5974 RepID=A0A8J8NBH7_HALGN|nr:hypothetical protein FGO68_gene14458 [Halteria grandinella]